MYYNRVILVGRLTKDPETRYTAKGALIVHFTLAVNRDNASDEADFIRITAFGRLAEFAKEYLSKGRLILVEGSIRTHYWDSEKGERHYATEVVAYRVRFLEKKQTMETSEQLETNDQDLPPF